MTDHVSIDGLDWQLTAETEATLQQKVRRGAFHSARVKAQDYASAYSNSSASASEDSKSVTGTSSDKLVCKEVEDFADRQGGDGSGGGGGGMRPMVMMSSKRMGGGGGEHEAVDLQPQEIAVTAGVTCIFEYSK